MNLPPEDQDDPGKPINESVRGTKKNARPTISTIATRIGIAGLTIGAIVGFAAVGVPGYLYNNNQAKKVEDLRKDVELIRQQANRDIEQAKSDNEAKNAAIAQMNSAVLERDNANKIKDQAVADRNNANTERDNAFVTRDQAIQDAKLARQKESEVIALNSALKNHLEPGRQITGELINSIAQSENWTSGRRAIVVGWLWLQKSNQSGMPNNSDLESCIATLDQAQDSYQGDEAAEAMYLKGLALELLGRHQDAADAYQSSVAQCKGDQLELRKKAQLSAIRANARRLGISNKLDDSAITELKQMVEQAGNIGGNPDSVVALHTIATAKKILSSRFNQQDLDWLSSHQSILNSLEQAFQATLDSSRTENLNPIEVDLIKGELSTNLAISLGQLTKLEASKIDANSQLQITNLRDQNSKLLASNDALTSGLMKVASLLNLDLSLEAELLKASIEAIDREVNNLIANASSSESDEFKRQMEKLEGYKAFAATAFEAVGLDPEAALANTSRFYAILDRLKTMAGFNKVENLTVQQVAECEFGKGVHAFFDRDLDLAIAQFNKAIEKYDFDARFHYFRILAKHQKGESVAQSDISKAASLEKDGLPISRMINRAFERVQGKDRGWLESQRKGSQSWSSGKPNTVDTVRYNQDLLKPTGQP